MVRFEKLRWRGLAFLLVVVSLPAIAAGAMGQSGQSSQATQNTANQGTKNQSTANQATSNQGDSGQNSKPLSLSPALPGMGKNHRLILKDGSYQLARDYQIVGDRVRYLSQERGDWEELPVDLVDWDATRRWEKEHADLADPDVSPAMKEAEAIDKEEADERNDQKARMPDVATGLELPDEEGVFVLDTYHGTPELVELKATDLSLNAKTRHGIGILNPLAGQRAGLELQGAHAKVHLHVNDPAIYLSLGVDEQKEPVLSKPMTVQTNGADAANGGEHGAHSAQSGFVIVRVDERQAVRIVGSVHMSASGTVTQNEDTIPTKVEVLPGKHWMRLTPEQKLTIGEYALVEIISPSDISESVWDFRVDPTLGDNPGSMGPILPQGRDAQPLTSGNPSSDAPILSEHPDQ